jgi:hypothetical protein
MCCNRDFFKSFDASHKENVYIANGVKLKCHGIGNGFVDVEAPNGGQVRREITNVLYVPDLRENLLSVSHLTERGFQLTFKGTVCEISYQGEIMAIADMQKELYRLRQCPSSSAGVVVNNKAKSDCVHCWH